MNSARLAKFNKEFLSIIAKKYCGNRPAVEEKLLAYYIALAERELFAESLQHPTVNNHKHSLAFLMVIMVFLWFFLYASFAYSINLLTRALIYLQGKQWRNTSKMTRFYLISYPGKTFESYSHIARNNKGTSVCVLGPNSWKKIIFEKNNEAIYETLLTTNPLKWISNFFFLSKQIALLESVISWDFPKKERSIARFLYSLLKQITMRSRSEKIIRTIKEESLFIFSSESISYMLVENLKSNNHQVCHHLHGITLSDNLLNEPSLSEYIITSGLREVEIYDKYKKIKCIFSTPPTQMYNDIISAKKIKPTHLTYDILIIASFELPFIQKSTYSILENSFREFAEKKILLRHHPRAPIHSKKLLNDFIPYYTISKSKTLVEDVNRSKVVVCCSVDALIISLIMKKSTIFLPMVDGDHKYYTQPFDGILPNLWCPDSAQELTNHIKEASLFEFCNVPSNYEKIIEYLFGTLDLNGLVHAINNIIEHKEKIND